MSDHLHIGALISIWLPIFASMVGAAIAIFTGARTARSARARDFDSVVLGLGVRLEGAASSSCRTTWGSISPAGACG